VRDPATVVKAFIDELIDAWPRGDAAGPANYFTEDAVYHNGPLDPAVGRQAIRETFAQLMAMGGTVNVELRHFLSDDRVVMTERVDHFVTEVRSIALSVMGICEIRDGRIAAWRDYFDLTQLNS
jgi:limonene-1,2-epoxide hydrolase